MARSVGLFVLHRCDNPRCVNPAHLFLGSHSDNMCDMRRKGRGNEGFRRYGEAHHRAKLTADQVRQLRALRDAGVPTIELAARYGLDPATVRAIAARRAWRHVA